VDTGRPAIVRPRHAGKLLEAFSPGTARIIEAEGFGHNDLQVWPAYHALIAQISQFVR
jgi:hypothetical protein